MATPVRVVESGTVTRGLTEVEETGKSIRRSGELNPEAPCEAKGAARHILPKRTFKNQKITNTFSAIEKYKISKTPKTTPNPAVLTKLHSTARKKGLFSGLLSAVEKSKFATFSTSTRFSTSHRSTHKEMGRSRRLKKIHVARRKMEIIRVI